MENCVQQLSSVIRFLRGLLIKPRHATYASAYPVETNSPPAEAFLTMSSIPDEDRTHNLLKIAAH